MNRIHLLKPKVGVEEEDSLSKILRGGWIAPVGPELQAFESDLEQFYENRRVLLLNSGTAALHLSLILGGVTKGDHVVTSTLTFAACANAILYQGAIPVFIDSESETWNLDPDLLDAYLSSCEKIPRAIIATHLYGMPAKLHEIKRIADKHGILLVEDAAESFGSKLQGRFLGQDGSYGIVSFNGNKIITTGGGGALVMEERDYDRALHLATQANRGESVYDHDSVGYNYRMSNVLAGLGIVQLKKLNEFIERKRQLTDRYSKELGSYFDFYEEPNGALSNRWLTVGLIREVSLLNSLIEFLKLRNIECRRVWKPLHLHTPYTMFHFVENGVSIDLFNKGICFPSGSGLTDLEQDYVIDSVKAFFKNQ